MRKLLALALSASLAGFLLERCILSATARIGSPLLYEAYVAWHVEKNTGPAEDQRTFNSQLEAHDPGKVRKKKTGGLMVWTGVALKSEPAVEDMI